MQALLTVRHQNAEYIRTAALYQAVGEAIAKRAISAGWIGEPLCKRHNFTVWRPDAGEVIRGRIAKGEYPPLLPSEVLNRAKWKEERKKATCVKNSTRFVKRIKRAVRAIC